MKIFVLVPSYKPDQRLPDLVQRLVGSRRYGGVTVVDDGSGHDFASIFDQVRAMSGAEVLSHGVNLGKGAALKSGLDHILGCHGHDIGIVTLDGDGQHQVTDAIKVTDALTADPSKLVLGSRQFTGDVPWRSRFGNGVTRTLFRLFYGLDLQDTQTGLRGLPGRFAVEALTPRSNRYDYELEMLILTKRTGTVISEVSIETIYLDGNRTSHFNPLIDSLKIYFALMRYAVAGLAAAVIDNLLFIACFEFGLPILQS